MLRSISIASLLLGAQTHEQVGFYEGKIRKSSTRNLSSITYIYKTVLSKAVYALFHNPFAGKYMKTGACLAGYLLSDLDLTRTDLFEKWFDDESSMTLAQAGVYTGTESIREYVNFIYSRYFNTYESISSEQLFEITDDSDACYFASATKRQVDLNASFYEPACVHTVGAAAYDFRLTGDDTFLTLNKANIFYPTAFLEGVFGLPRSEDLAEYVCSVMETNCEDVWENITSMETCKDEFLALNVSESEMQRFDGNTRGCRMVHSTFAETNPDHCPHMSFESMVDVNGKIKCQTSEEIDINDLFTSTQLSFIEEAATKLGFDETMYTYSSGACTN